MPLTFLAHQAVVLPLKLRAPRWFSGTALVVGSMAPDVEYYVRGIPAGGLAGHTWLGQLTLCLPIALVLYWAVTRVMAEPVAANLPEAGSFRLRDYALLREQPSTLVHWAMVGASALTGSVSHVVLDRATGGWSAGDYIQRRSWLPPTLLSSDRAWAIVQVVLWVVLGFACVAMLLTIGRRRLLRVWASERGAVAARRYPMAVRPVLFWSAPMLAAVAAIAWGATHRRPGYPLHEHGVWVHIGLRTVSCIFLATLLMSGAWQLRARRSHSSLRSSQ